MNAPTVTGSACTSVSYTSATGNGNITVTGGANATTRGFCYMVGTTGDPTTSNSTAFDTGSFGVGAYTKSITGLTQGTSYRVRAYAINSAGTGYGTTVQLTTTANTAPTVVLNTANAYDFGTNTTPTLNFTGTDTQVDAIEYNVQIDTVNTFDSVGLISKFSATDVGFTAGHPFSGNGSTPIDYTVQSTLSGGTYYWRVAAIDPLGLNVYGAWATTRSFMVTLPFAISGTSNQTSGTVSVAVNTTLQAQTGTIAGNGTWTISGVTRPASGDAITVFVSNAVAANISTAVTTYSGTGSIVGMVLDKHVLSVGSNQNRSIVLSDLAKYDYDQDTTHIIHSANGTPATLLMKFANGSSYVDEKISILAGNTLTIGTTETLTTYDLTIAGTLVSSGAAAFNVAHNWVNTSGTFTAGSSTVTLNGTTQQTLSGTLSSTSSFYNLTITNSSGATATNGERTGFTPGVIFSNTDATATNNYTITTSNVRVEYSSTHTYTFANINWSGTAGNLICFRNSLDSAGGWSLKVTGTQTVSYVNVSRSTAIITSGGVAISAFDGTNTNAGSNTGWTFVNTRIRQEINLINGSFASTTGAITPVRLSSINPNYSGTATPYFEIVAKNTDSVSRTVFLLNQSGDGLIAQIDIPGSTSNLTRFRSSDFKITMPTAFTQVYVSIPITPSAGQVVVNAARVVILQDLGANPLTNTETQIEIGDYETLINTTAAPLTYPKYWKYTAASWDAGVNFMAEVAYSSSNALGLVTVKLQKDNAGDFSFTDVVTIVSASGPTAATLSPRISFTPVDGCNYQLSVVVAPAYNYTIYNAKIIVSQANQDLITAAYDNKSFSIGLQDATAHGLAFSYDGTKMYCLGDTSDKVYQYTLNPAWDVSSADYSAAKSLLISGQSTASAGITISSDGKKFYVMANTGSVMQYSIPTAWDISTATYDSVTKAIGGEDLTARQVSFKPDGTKMYVGGSTNDKIYQYSLSSAWIVSSATYDGVSLSVLGQDSSSRGDMISWDGTRVYMSGNTAPVSIYQYNLSTPWDLSTATYANRKFSVNSQDNNTYGIQCKPDGTKIYFIGAQNGKVYQYSMSAAPNTTVLETQYLLQNTNKGATGLQDYDTYWSPTDWSGTYNKNFYHEINSSADTADAAKLQSDPNGTPADVTGSSATGTALRSRSGAMTMPSSAATIDTNITNVPIYASRIIAAVSVPCFPTVISPTATGISIPNATMGANVTSDGGSALTARGIVWGTSPQPTTNMAAEGGTSIGVYTQFVTTLLAGAMIYYRGYATNSLGTGYSEDGGAIIPSPNAAVQYDSDHVTKIATGGSTTNTSVYLDFSTTAMSLTEDVTPKVEVKAIGSAFTGTATHTGSAFNFSPGCPRMRSFPAVVYDATNKRMVVFGGKDDTGAYLNDTWELKIPTSANPNPVWRQMSPTGTPPSVRTAMVYVYDSVGYRMIIFGGTTATVLGGFFSLDLSTADGAWSSFTPSGTVPTNRSNSVGIFDSSTNRRMIIFGGYTTVDKNDTYSITLPDNLANSASTQLSPGGTIPTPRSEHVAIFDSANQRMIVFGGWGASFYNDVKSLSLTSGTEAWVPLTVNGTAPYVRCSHVAIYDSVNQRMVTGLGRNQEDKGLGDGLLWYSHNDIFSLSIPTGNTFSWTNNTAAAGSLPAKRHAAAAAYDSFNKRALIFGGLDRSLSMIGNETLVVDVSSNTGTLYCKEFNALTNLTPGDGSEAVYDSYNKQMVRFGGYGHIYNLATPDTTGYHQSEVWTYCVDGGSSKYNSLNNITPSIGPLAGEVAATIYDSNYRRFVRFGSLGYNQDQSLNDTWTMSLDPARADYHVWVRLTTTGGPPAVRWGAANIFDPVNSRMIIFGGCDSNQTSTHYNDAWQLSLPNPDSSPTYTWTSISAGTPPSARFQSTAIYDSTNVRMLVFGGRTATPTYLNDLWELNWDNGTPNTFTWTDRTPSYTPALTGRRGQTTEYDSTYNRMIMFGGWDGASTHFNEVWSFDVSALTVTATLITTSGTSPVVRRSHNAIFDPNPTPARMIIQGGRGGLTPTNFLKDFWELTLPSGTSGWTWTQLNPTTYLKTSVSVPTLTNNTGYHWQAWSTGSVSGDTLKVSYGGNLESVADFIIGNMAVGMKVWNGTDWVYKPVKVYNGLTWVAKPVKVYNGVDWVVKG